MNENESANAAEDPNKKPFPDWGVSGDHQNLIIGLLIILLVAGGIGLNSCLGDDGDDPTAVVTEAVDGDGDATDSTDVTGSTLSPTTEPTPTTAPSATSAPEAEESVAPTSAPTVDLAPDVAAAVAAFPGVSGTAEGTTAVLTGFVDSSLQSTDVQEAAAAVPGIESVDNQLVPVDEGALSALTNANVTEPIVVVDKLEVAVSGTIESEQDRQPALDAVAAVPGVAGVLDRLTVAEPAGGESMTDSLNKLVELEPVQFATSSNEILAESNPTLDAAAQIMTDNPDGGAVEVQGYTDIRGDAAANEALSQARAGAVVQALVDRGVAPERLTAKGFGGTTQFDEGTTSEAYAANRRVVFAPVDTQ